MDGARMGGSGDSPAGRRGLVIEDDADIIRLLTDVLTAQGYVVTAPTSRRVKSEGARWRRSSPR